MENIQALLESSKFTPLSASDSAAMRLMLENTEKEHARLVAEGTLAGDVSQFTPILMPMVRRVYPNLIANELLGVQAMAMPTGFIYALTNAYTGTGNNFASPNAGAVILDITTSAGMVEGENIAGAADVTGVDPVETAQGVILYVEGNRILVKVTSGSFAVGTKVQEGVTVAQNTTNTITAAYTNEASFGLILNAYTGSYATSVAEALAKNMKEVGFSISKKSVEAKSRALKGQYTVEMYQDLKAQHGLLADEEVMSLMSYEMQAEIDREVVTFVNANSTQLSDTVFAAQGANPSVDGGRWEIEKYRVQAIRISKEAAQIGIDTKRGQGNTLLVSPKVAIMLEQVGTFKTASQASSVSAPVSGGVAGTFDGRFKVIVDQYAVSNYCTVLYKGADRRDAMGFFAPYVPASFTKVTNSDSGQPAIICKTRYALDTIPGVSTPASNDRAKAYSRTFGVNFANTILA